MIKFDNNMSRQKIVSIITDSMIRIGLIAFVVVMCIKVFAPFVGLMLWALVLAIALYPMHLKLANMLGGKQGRSAVIIVLSGLLLVGGPSVMVGNSFQEHVSSLYTRFEAGTLSIDPPSKDVAEWPLVGERIYKSWNMASENLPKYIDSVRPQLKTLSKKAVELAASTAGGVLAFLGSLIIAGILMAYGTSGRQSMRSIFVSFTDSTKGPQLQELCINTIRSVATGVIGVAFIQALLLGVGFVLAGIPGAGVLALVVLVLGILQLPAAVVSIPAIAYLWMGGDGSTTMNMVFSVYLLIAGLADNVLKPLLLGRGVDVPMPIVLFGALGGMVSAGIIGLFLGAAMLAIGYQIFMDWVHTKAQAEEMDSTSPSDP